MFATLGIVLFAPLLARWALAFGPAEYFALMCFAFACITCLMGDAPMKAVLAAVIGLSLSTIGLDSNSGVYQFTGDNLHLSDGIQFTVVVIGVFSISEILLMLEQQHSNEGIIKETGRTLFNMKEMALTWWGTVRSSLPGFIVGVLPGAGATITSAMAYSMEKRFTGADGHFGQGDIRGVAAPEAANSASAAGILAISAGGVFWVHTTTFDLMLMSIFCVAGYLLRKQGVPMAPLILGLVLGDMMEQNLRRALSITNGKLGILIESPICKGLWIVAAAMIVVPPLMRMRAGPKVHAVI